MQKNLPLAMYIWTDLIHSLLRQKMYALYGMKLLLVSRVVPIMKTLLAGRMSICLYCPRFL